LRSRAVSAGESLGPARPEGVEAAVRGLLEELQSRPIRISAGAAFTLVTPLAKLCMRLDESVGARRAARLVQLVGDAVTPDHDRWIDSLRDQWPILTDEVEVAAFYEGLRLVLHGGNLLERLHVLIAGQGTIEQTLVRHGFKPQAGKLYEGTDRAGRFGLATRADVSAHTDPRNAAAHCQGEPTRTESLAALKRWETFLRDFVRWYPGMSPDLKIQRLWADSIPRKREEKKKLFQDLIVQVLSPNGTPEAARLFARAYLSAELANWLVSPYSSFSEAASLLYAEADLGLPPPPVLAAFRALDREWPPDGREAWSSHLAEMPRALLAIEKALKKARRRAKRDSDPRRSRSGHSGPTSRDYGPFRAGPVGGGSKDETPRASRPRGSGSPAETQNGSTGTRDQRQPRAERGTPPRTGEGRVASRSSTETGTFLGALALLGIPAALLSVPLLDAAQHGRGLAGVLAVGGMLLAALGCLASLSKQGELPVLLGLAAGATLGLGHCSLLSFPVVSGTRTAGSRTVATRAPDLPVRAPGSEDLTLEERCALLSRTGGPSLRECAQFRGAPATRKAAPEPPRPQVRGRPSFGERGRTRDALDPRPLERPGLVCGTAPMVEFSFEDDGDPSPRRVFRVGSIDMFDAFVGGERLPIVSRRGHLEADQGERCRGNGWLWEPERRAETREILVRRYNFRGELLDVCEFSGAIARHGTMFECLD